MVFEICDLKPNDRHSSLLLNYCNHLGDRETDKGHRSLSLSSLKLHFLSPLCHCSQTNCAHQKKKFVSKIHEEVLMDILQLPAIIQGQQKRVKVTDKKTNTPKIPCMILTPATDANPNPIQHKNNCPLRSPQSRHVRKHIGHHLLIFFFILIGN